MSPWLQMSPTDVTEATDVTMATDVTEATDVTMATGLTMATDGEIDSTHFSTMAQVVQIPLQVRTSNHTAVC